MRGPGPKCIIATGGILVVLCIVLILSGLFLIPYGLNTQVLDYLVVDSSSSPQYDDWAGGYDVKSEYQMVFYFFNLTNSDDVRQNGLAPIYNTVGPYVYRRYRHSVNVSFPDGGNQIKYTDFRDYQYDLVASENRSNSDIIINLNPIYVAAGLQTGSELALLTAAVGGIIVPITSYLTGPFISLYTSYQLPNYLPDIVSAQIAEIDKAVNGTKNATLLFVDAWVNNTSPPAYGNFTGLLISVGRPSNISVSSALALLDKNQQYSLYDTSADSAWVWQQSQSNATYMSLLQGTLHLTEEQVMMIWNWRTSSFGPTFMYPGLINKFNLSAISDLGWEQFTFGDVLGTMDNPVSVNDLWGDTISEIGYSYDIELFAGTLGGVANTFTSWNLSKQVMNPTTGLGNVYIFQAFALAVSDNANGNFSMWGLTTDQAGFVQAYAIQMGYANIVPMLLDRYGPTGGLILSQSIDDWVFNCDRLMLDLLQPEAPFCSFLQNHSVYSANVIYSGKNNISEINQYTEWQMNKTIEGLWNGPLNVSGVTELGQVAPFQKKGGIIQVFDDNTIRSVYLNYTNTSTVADIAAYQYVLDYKKLFGNVNNFYFQTVPGLVNATAIKEAPIFFSLWDMLYVNESIRSRVVGLTDNTTEYNSSTVLDIEPTTGNTIRSRKRIQPNLQIPEDCLFCTAGSTAFGNDNVRAGTYFPLVKAGEYATISPSLASTLSGKLHEINNVQHYGLIGGTAGGGVLGLIGIILIIVGCRRQPSDGYSEIN